MSSRSTKKREIRWDLYLLSGKVYIFPKTFPTFSGINAVHSTQESLDLVTTFIGQQVISRSRDNSLQFCTLFKAQWSILAMLKASRSSLYIYAPISPFLYRLQAEHHSDHLIMYSSIIYLSLLHMELCIFYMKYAIQILAFNNLSFYFLVN